LGNRLLLEHFLLRGNRSRHGVWRKSSYRGGCVTRGDLFLNNPLDNLHWRVIRKLKDATIGKFGAFCH
jgi:hypothetical protein